ncbi:uncharacterized protein LOC118186661 isoform X2 [Stegodyphus dumicola]|nr:uncharacterized protein LOC118186661 isoform X2 [Stegodyphus dumicola]XP_035212673.1 uncharacterized protein LOC118186661 isoform X2 [Stegodyphus dumicola]XP_035212674.1 uncharacterized protein LOC118186661 isoform X2 [Stegodyphus dumicola]
MKLIFCLVTYAILLLTADGNADHEAGAIENDFSLYEAASERAETENEEKQKCKGMLEPCDDLCECCDEGYYCVPRIGGKIKMCGPFQPEKARKHGFNCTGKFL